MRSANASFRAVFSLSAVACMGANYGCTPSAGPPAQSDSASEGADSASGTGGVSASGRGDDDGSGNGSASGRAGESGASSSADESEASSEGGEASASEGGETESSTEGGGDSGGTGAEDNLDEAYNSIVAADIQKHVDYLASDELMGRDSRSQHGHTAAAYIADEFESYGLEPFGDHGSYFAEYRGHSPNVVAIRRGTGDGYLVFAGHYDHLEPERSGDDKIYNGADDNASGTAATLELAHAFSILNNDLQHSQVFIGFTAEEHGMLGSKHWVENTPIQLDQIQGVINMDMVSRGDSNSIFCEQAAEFPVLSEAVREANKRVELEIRWDEHPEWREQSDHYSFLQAGVPALYFGVEDHPDYHRVSDHADKILPDLTANVAKLGFQWAITLDGIWDTRDGWHPPPPLPQVPLRHPDRHHRHECRR